jgi:hypothetical protein
MPKKGSDAGRESTAAEWYRTGIEPSGLLKQVLTGID